MLKNTDSARIAPLVQRLLADQQDTDPRLAIERMRRTRGQIAPTPPVRVEADPRTNSLIVSGAARIMSVYRDIEAMHITYWYLQNFS